MGLMSKLRDLLNYFMETSWEGVEESLEQVRKEERKILDAGERAFENGYKLTDNPFVGDTEVSRLWSKGYCTAQNKKVLKENFGTEFWY